MPRRIDYLKNSVIPDGVAVFEQRLEVAGVHHYKKDAQRFLEGSRPCLTLEPEPGNPVDANAIKVIAVWKAGLSTRRAQVGHVPATVAASLAASGLSSAVGASLADTFVGDTGFVVIAFQLIGPADRYQDYAAHTGNAPVGDTWNEKMQREAEARLIEIYRSLTKKGREHLLALAETTVQSHRSR